MLTFLIPIYFLANKLYINIYTFNPILYDILVIICRMYDINHAVAIPLRSRQFYRTDTLRFVSATAAIKLDDVVNLLSC